MLLMAISSTCAPSSGKNGNIQGDDYLSSYVPPQFVHVASEGPGGSSSEILPSDGWTAGLTALLRRMDAKNTPPGTAGTFAVSKDELDGSYGIESWYVRLRTEDFKEIERTYKVSTAS